MIDRQIANLLVKLGMDSSAFGTGIDKAESKLTKAAATMGKIGKVMTMGVTLPIVAAGVAITKMAMDFEDKMAFVSTMMDDATIASKNWGQEILDLGKTLPKTTDDLANGLYDVLSAGISAADSMEVLGVAGKAATAGLADTRDTVRVIDAALNAYSLDAKEAADVSDILFQTVRYGVTTFPELAQAMGKVIPTAAAANVAFEEVGAAIAQITLVGLDTNQAVTALNGLILQFISPTEQAKEVARKFGFELSATTLSTKGLGGAFTELVTKLGISTDELIELEKAGKSENEILDFMAFKAGLTSEQFSAMFQNVRALKGALALAKNGGDDFNEMLQRMEERAGAVNEAYEKIANTTKHKFTLAINNLKIAGIELGQQMLPMASELFEKITSLAQSFGNLDEKTKKNIITIAGILAIMGPLLLVGSSATKIFIALKGAIVATNTALVTTSAILIPLILTIIGITKAIQAFEYSAGSADKIITDFSTSVKAINREMASFKSNIQFHFGDTEYKKLAFQLGDNLKILEDLNTIFPEVEDKIIAITRSLKNGNITEKEAVKQIAALTEEYKKLRNVLDTEQIDNHTEAMIRAKEMITKYGETFPEVAALIKEYYNNVELGIISEDKFDKKMQDVQRDMKRYTEVLAYLNSGKEASGSVNRRMIELEEQLREKYGLTNEEMQKGAQYVKEFAEAQEGTDYIIAKLMKTLDLSRTQAEKAAGAWGLLGLKIEDADKAYQDLYNTVFGLSLTEDDLEEAIWAVDDALVEYLKKIKDLKEGTREYEQLKNDLNDTYAEEFSKVGAMIEENPDYLKTYDDIRKKLGEQIIELYKYGDVNEDEWKNAVALLGLSKTDIDGILSEMSDSYDKNIINKLKEVKDETGLKWRDVVKIVQENATIKIPEMIGAMGVSYDEFISGPLINFETMTAEEWVTALGAMGASKIDMEKVLEELGFAHDEISDVVLPYFTSQSAKKWQEAYDKMYPPADKIIKKSNEVGRNINNIPNYKSIVFTQTGADTVIEKASALSRVLSSVSTNITTQFGLNTPKLPYPLLPYTGGAISELGHLQRFASGGATPNFIVPNTVSKYPALLDPNELILNSQSQANLLFRLSKSKGGDGGSIQNIFNITEMIVREEADIKRIARELSVMTQNKLTGMGIKNV